MHFDYALNFCSNEGEEDIGQKQTDKKYNVEEDIGKLIEAKLWIYETAAKLLDEYGYKESSQKYWNEGIKNKIIGERLHIKYGVHLYEKQKFDEAKGIFQYYFRKSIKTKKGTDPAAAVFTARINLDLGEYQKAMDIYSKILPQGT